MDTIPGSEPMENLPHSPLGGLDPANLLKQGAAEDTFVNGAVNSFKPLSIEELAAIFPQFEILELIGQGGMGAVYKVRQKDLDRIVALKILPPAIGQSSEFAARFTREAKALGKLNHPGIVTLHEFGQQDGLYFILMEFVDGVNLAQLMKSGRISPREALAIVPQICEALQFAHDQGIVHRDIKPENLLLDRLGRVKIADFGIAKVVAAVCDRPAEEEGYSRRSEIDATLAGKILGTPQYMAPEQISHPAEVDHRADIYALGVVFYQMLTGELPGKCLEAPSKKVHIDVRLDEIVLRAMEKEPEMRYQTAHEFRTVIDGVQAPAHALPPSLPLAPPKRSMLRRWWWVFLVMFPLGPLIGLAAASVLTHFTPKKYESSVTIMVKPTEGSAMPRDILGSQIKALKSKKTLEAVAEQLELPKKWMLSQDAVVQRLLDISTTQNIRGTDLISIGVRHTDPQEAVAIVRLLAQNYQRNFPGEVVIHEEPSEPNAPSSPNVRLNHAIGALLGLMLSPFLAIILIAILQRLFPETKSMNSPNLGRVNKSGPAVKKLSILSIFLIVFFCIFTLIPALVGTAVFLWYRLAESKTGNHLSSENGDAPISTSSGVTNASDRLDMQVDPPLLMTEFGEFKSEQSPWRIHVSAEDRKLQISRQLGGIGTGISPDHWRAQEGWFAFIEDQNHAWAYDGDKELVLVDVGIEANTLYSTEIISRRVPEVILPLISQATRNTIGTGVGRTNREVDRKAVPNLLAGAWLLERKGSLNGIDLETGSLVTFHPTPTVLFPVEDVEWRKKYGVDLIMDLDSNELGVLVAGVCVKEVAADWWDETPEAGVVEAVLPPWAEASRIDERMTSISVAGPSSGSKTHVYRTLKGSVCILRFRPTDHLSGLWAEYRVILDRNVVNAPDSIQPLISRSTLGRVGAKSGNIPDAEKTEIGGPEIGVLAAIWISGIDAGKYSQSWKDAAVFFQTAITEGAWVSALEGVRKPLGAVKSREIRDTKKVNKLPGAPDGEYFVIQFDTSFASKDKAVETVTFMLEKNGTWRASGYFIR